MATEDIMALDIPSDKNAVLFLWATAPKLEDALRVMKAWGFTYKTHAAWDKGRVGIGFWFLGQHELLLIGTKGTFHPPTEKERISSVIRSRKREHSRKPDHIRLYIQTCYPTFSKLELFARQRFEGWDVWGNEAPTDTQITLGSQITPLESYASADTAAAKQSEIKE